MIEAWVVLQSGNGAWLKEPPQCGGLVMKLRGLRQARQRQGLSISQLAEMTGLRRESISRFEHGQEEPQPYALRRLSTVLETPLAELLGMPEARAPVSALS
jgi:transcriptional regulator with XRE-family HTH domain